MGVNFDNMSKKRKITLTIIGIIYIIVLANIASSYRPKLLEVIAATLGCLTAVLIAVLWIDESRPFRIVATPKTKNIIAKEGLIFLGFLFLSIIVGMLFRDTRYSGLRLLDGYSYKVFSFKNMIITFSGYPIYLSTRFTIWAIRTLRGKTK